ncbi:hypothetical protein CAPTEDRAFT_153741 [Capitella teleta]|uniref:Dolichol phosphate-mannose biosynthesis regulatory protein n=1 Tax=Capitella teleta TaxID=283909 RepID=R7UNV0_CAPTE|nr:hypothetical protein CAPTEDRAFT_153741 [Capitella teleta]|eukprot:ELU05592.1 hypothetical protein CAPTEDRAFT_153741 [Capitella teleta]
MATGSDRSVGYGLVALALSIFTYYTVWVIILPFVNDDHVIHQYFLPRVYALILPILAGVIVLSALGGTIAVILGRPKKQKTS